MSSTPCIMGLNMLNLKLTNDMKAFNSQVCTTLEQSERLLALGLKKETADMIYRTFGYVVNGEVKERIYEKPQIYDKRWNGEHDIPAWSLHRLIEMFELVPYEIYPMDSYNVIISEIEDAIKDGYFNKDYLNEA